MGDEFDEFLIELCKALSDAWKIRDEKHQDFKKNLRKEKHETIELDQFGGFLRQSAPKENIEIPAPKELVDLLCSAMYLGGKRKGGRGLIERYFDSYVFTPELLTKLRWARGRTRINSCPPVIARFISPIKTTRNGGLCCRQVVDWRFDKIGQSNPWVFFELESMDRAQIYLFADPLKNGQYWTKENDNKLWYYYWTLAKHYLGQRDEVPRYFVFFLCLPKDQLPSGYRNAAGNDYHWDNHYYHWDFYQSPQLGINPQTINPANSVYPSPFQFYWPKIKQLCAKFLNNHLKSCNCQTLTGNWSAEDLEKFLRNGCSKCNSSPQLNNLQEKCELILIAYNCHKQLIVSRGKYLFDCAKDQIWDI
jgi:hypothetical protein